MTTHSVNLRDFLTTNRLGPLALGQSTRFVTQVLGDADDLETEDGVLWFFGCLQICVKAQKIAGLCILVERGFPHISSEMELEPAGIEWIKLTPDSFRNECTASAIKFTEVCGAEYHCFNMSAGPWVSFVKSAKGFALKGLMTWAVSGANR